MLAKVDPDATYAPPPTFGVPAPTPTGGDNTNMRRQPLPYPGPGTASAPYISTNGDVNNPHELQPAPPPKITTTPGYDPDYGALIKSDPGYAAAQAAATAAQQQADAVRRQNVRDFYIKYGGKMPAGWKDAYGDIDQATQDAAANNQFSTIAGLGRNYDQSLAQFKKALAARGMLQSGDLSYGQNQIDMGYGQQQYDAANAFNSQYSGALGGYADVLGTNARNMASAIQGAEANVYSNPAYRPREATTADYDPVESAKAGTAVYKGADGTLYTSDGKPYTPKTVTPPPTTPPAGTFLPGYNADRSNDEARQGWEWSKAHGGVPVILPGGGIIQWQPDAAAA